MRVDRSEIRGAVARGWCHPANAAKVMDTDLAEAISDEVQRFFVPERDESRRLLEAASHSLRSYQYGNTATDPAKDMADAIDRFLKTGEPQTLAGKAL